MSSARPEDRPTPPIHAHPFTPSYANNRLVLTRSSWSTENVSFVPHRLRKPVPKQPGRSPAPVASSSAATSSRVALRAAPPSPPRLCSVRRAGAARLAAAAQRSSAATCMTPRPRCRHRAPTTTPTARDDGSVRPGLFATAVAAATAARVRRNIGKGGRGGGKEERGTPVGFLPLVRRGACVHGS